LQLFLEHTVTYNSTVDSIEIYCSQSWGFALGAIIAAEWIVGKQGFHNERRFRIKINQINFWETVTKFPVYKTKIKLCLFIYGLCFPICTNSTLLGTWNYMKLLAENVGAAIPFTTLLSWWKSLAAHLVDLVTFIPIINLIMFPVIWIETLRVLEKI
jgi:hypothetical protein